MNRICQSPPSGLVGWWPLDAANNNVFPDLIGRRDAHGGPGISSVNGQVDGAVGLAGNGQFLSVPSGLGNSLSSGLTVSAWVNSSTPSQNAVFQSVLSQWSSNSSFNSFVAYDASTTSGMSTKSFIGGAFDGRYVYFSPFNGSTVHVLRYDTIGSFNSATSWTAYDASGTDGATIGGSLGSVFDGRYVYFIPGSGGVTFRYDTQGSFTQSASWHAHDVTSTSGLTTTGFVGGTFDGKYVYFVPYNGGSGTQVLRYKITGDFQNASSYQVYDATNTSGLSSQGYTGAGFDGRYLYFTPRNSGVALRYDTNSNFTSSSSWLAYDASNTSGLTTNGFTGAAFDGRYLYYVPNSGGAVGNVLRYDTQGVFNQSSSWVAYNAGSTNGLASQNYAGAIFDGRYVYFEPNGHTVMLRYDVQAPFTSSGAWTAIDTNNTSGMTLGSIGGVFDGRNIYFVPFYDGSAASGKVLRYDTTGSNATFSLNYGSPGGSDGWGGSLLGAQFRVNTLSGIRQATLPSTLTPGWHLLTGTFDTSTTSLYVDGQLAVQTPGTGTLITNGANLVFGSMSQGNGYLAGSLDEIQIYQRALSASDVQSIFSVGGDGLFCK